MGAAQAARLEKLRSALVDRDLDAMVVQERQNTRYLTGFVCSYSILIVDANGGLFITDSRYAEAAEKAIGADFKVIIQPTQKVREFLRDEFKKLGYKTAGYEGAISVDEYDQMKWWTRGTKLRNAGDLITELRMVKDDDELRIIKRAVKLADTMMEFAFTLLKPGSVENDISRRIRFASEELGGEGESFPNILASGPNSSRPHHRGGTRKLKANEPITVDLGAIVQGYCSDLTRTPVLGKVPKKFEEIYEVCLRANEEAIKQLRPGMTGKEVDLFARNVIEEAGYGKFFGHGLGHGVGLDIHEEPRLSPRAGDYKLRPGNIVTIEPGIYLPGEFGVRIEDYVLVTEKGAKVLSKSPKQLRSLKP